MGLPEIGEAELIAMMRAGTGKAAVLFHTPFCGTCKLAERMLEIAKAASVSADLYKLNVNFAPNVTAEWKISSVPSLALLKDGKLLRLEYTMQSVDYLYGLLKTLD